MVMSERLRMSLVVLSRTLQVRSVFQYVRMRPRDQLNDSGRKHELINARFEKSDTNDA